MGAMKRAYAKGTLAGAVLIGLATLAAAPGSAETLADALAAAYANNPTILAQRAALRATDEEVPTALGGWRPTVSVSAEAGYQDISSKTQGVTTDDTLNPRSMTLSLSQPLFRGFRTVSSVERAENLVRAERARLAEVEQTVLLQAATAYLDVYRDQSVLELAINNEQRLRRQLEAAKDRFDVGEVTRTDVAQAESRLSNAIADRVRAEGDLTSSRAIYLNVVGRMPGTLAKPDVLGSLPEDEKAAQALAVANNPSVRRAIYASRAARLDVRIATGALLPELTLSGSYTMAEETSTLATSQDTATIKAQLSIPLYQSGAEYARVRAARAVASQRRLEVEQSKRAAAQDVTRGWEALQTARARIKAFEDSVRAAKIALQGVEEEASVGSRTTLDVLDAEQELFNARVDLVRAQRDALVAAFTLQAAVGGLTAEKLGLAGPVYDPTRHYRAVRDKLLGFDDGE